MIDIVYEEQKRKFVDISSLVVWLCHDVLWLYGAIFTLPQKIKKIKKNYRDKGIKEELQTMFTTWDWPRECFRAKETGFSAIEEVIFL